MKFIVKRKNVVNQKAKLMRVQCDAIKEEGAVSRGTLDIEVTFEEAKKYEPGETYEFTPVPVPDDPAT